MVGLSKIFFVEAANRELTWFFPQRMNNSVMLWAALNGTLGLIIFFLSYYFFGRHHGTNQDSWGLKISFNELLKTILLGLIVFASYYLILFIVYFFFHVDYRFWFMGVRVFQPEMILILLMYFPLFFIFFFSNSLRVNGSMRFKNQAEWKSRLIAGFANSLGLIFIIIIQYSVFAATGAVYWSSNSTAVSYTHLTLPTT